MQRRDAGIDDERAMKRDGKVVAIAGFHKEIT